MPRIKNPVINYTARDFASIKNELVNYAQKYYPETFRDFNEASFGSLLLDLVAYVGDITSFYTDYQANESFLDTALEFKNILKIAKQLGYIYRPNASSFGDVSFFITIPSMLGATQPDYAYAPILKKGSTFATTSNIMFTLIEDVDFRNTPDEILVASSNRAGTSPTQFALKAKGLVLSGELRTESFIIDDYKKFLKLEIFDDNLTEIVSVSDIDGNEYYEVEYLTQDVIFVPILNTNSNRKFAKNILKPISVPRRFTVEHKPLSTIIQFGYGTEDNEEKVLDPTNVILDIYGKNYISNKSFDPAVLTKTTKLGIVPSNTVVNVTYRRNSVSDVNVPANTLVSSINPIFKFINQVSLTPALITSTGNSLELTNEKNINGSFSEMSNEEIKIRARGAYSMQNRAVTKEDYISLCYNMPAKFGTIKRATLLKDETSFNGKNLNLYVISSDSLGSLIPTDNIIKQNLRNWINQYKMIGDTIDILDAHVINLQIEFTVVGFANINKFDVIESCISTLSDYYTNQYFDIGEPFKISDVYKLLNSVPTVVDTKAVNLFPKVGAKYSNYDIGFEDLISDDGRYLIPPKQAVFEIKFPAVDINGEIV